MKHTASVENRTSVIRPVMNHFDFEISGKRAKEKLHQDSSFSTKPTNLVFG